MAGQVPPQATPIKALRKMKSRTFVRKRRLLGHTSKAYIQIYFNLILTYIAVLLSILYIDLHLFELLQDEET